MIEYEGQYLVTYFSCTCFGTLFQSMTNKFNTLALPQELGKIIILVNRSAKNMGRERMREKEKERESERELKFVLVIGVHSFLKNFKDWF